MRKSILIILALFNSLFLFSQDEKRNYIELQNGEIINVEGKGINDNFLFSNKLKANGQKFAINEVEGYQKNGVYFKQYQGNFYKRLVHGKVNYYYRIDEKVESRYTNTGRETRTKQKLEQYIQKGDDGKMVKYTYNSLRTMIKDNKAAVKQLDKYKRSNRMAILITYPGVAVLCVGGAILGHNYLIKEKVDRDPTMASIGGITTAAGAGVFGYGVLKKFKSAKELHKVFEIYNK